ncbi:hypothetical protein GE21DRAFT_1012063 [Neurospora crassa]|nr:hypothetical protein GE21DRAFT_1012063 [Neurospora crassa]
MYGLLVMFRSTHVPVKHAATWATPSVSSVTLLQLLGPRFAKQSHAHETLSGCLQHLCEQVESQANGEQMCRNSA